MIGNYHLLYIEQLRFYKESINLLIIRYLSVDEDRDSNYLPLLSYTFVFKRLNDNHALFLPQNLEKLRKQQKKRCRARCFEFLSERKRVKKRTDGKEKQTEKWREKRKKARRDVDKNTNKQKKFNAEKEKRRKETTEKTSRTTTIHLSVHN